VTLFNKIPYQLILLLALSLLLSFCTVLDSSKLDDKEIDAYETELKSLIDQVNALDAKGRLNEFLSLYLEAEKIARLLPDTTKTTYLACWEFIPKLDEVGAYEEAIKKSWQYLSISELQNQAYQVFCSSY